MDDFAKLPTTERQLYFEQAAAQLNLNAQIVEKDFWVCWTLRRLFELQEFRDHLTFKGGTSLSKAYKLIERFSEDVDVAIERDFLGFGGDKDPEFPGISKKETTRRIEALRSACQAKIDQSLQPQLQEAMSATLATEASWSLKIDPDDPDQQSLRFEYPAVITGSLSPYFARSVKIEMGARSDHFPTEPRLVQPYVCDAFPDVIKSAETEVRVLNARRTLWEKATILHKLHHLPDGKPIPPRMSRHYYDVYQLINSDVIEEAMADLKLLERVTDFKTAYFPAAWARYQEAADGAIRLRPREERLPELKNDYEAMQQMFFGDPPEFDALIEPLAKLEERINSMTAH